MLYLIPINLIPILMIIFGTAFLKHVPKEINSFYGYRTPMSKKNQDTWNFAHQYCGKLWLFLGIVLCIVSILGSILTYRSWRNAIDTFSSIAISVQVIIIVATIIPTEVALKKTFDKNGHRR